MDPVSLVEVALTAGTAAGVKDTASSAVKDAYDALKAIVKSRFTGRPRAEMVFAEHETAPEIWSKPLISELTNVGVDADLVTRARALMQLLDDAGSRAGKYDVNIQGSQAVQVGDHNVQHNTYNTTAISGTTATSGQTRIGYLIEDDGEAESHYPRVRNQDIAFRVRGHGKLRDKGADIG
jgi:hypothetical protein